MEDQEELIRRILDGELSPDEARRAVSERDADFAERLERNGG